MKNYKNKKWYENKETNCIACGLSYERRYSPPHHVIRKTRLTKDEISQERYYIDLCFKCHHEYHFSRDFSGIRFYIKHKILNQVKQHVHDDRFDVWAECAIIKLGLQKEICEKT